MSCFDVLTTSFYDVFSTSSLNVYSTPILIRLKRFKIEIPGTKNAENAKMFPLLLSKGLICIVVRLIANFRLLFDAYPMRIEKSDCRYSAVRWACRTNIIFFVHVQVHVFVVTGVGTVVRHGVARLCQQIKRTEMRAKEPYGDKTAAASIERMLR